MPAGTQSAVLGLPPSQPAARVARSTARGTRFPSQWTPVNTGERGRMAARLRAAAPGPLRARPVGTGRGPRSRPPDPAAAAAAAASLEAVRAGSLRRPRVLPRQVVRGRQASANAGPARTRRRAPRSGAVRAAGLRRDGGTVLNSARPLGRHTFPTEEPRRWARILRERPCGQAPGSGGRPWSRGGRCPGRPPRPHRRPEEEAARPGPAGPPAGPRGAAGGRGEDALARGGA